MDDIDISTKPGGSPLSQDPKCHQRPCRVQLELPGGLWIKLPPGAITSDVAATPEWAAFHLTRVVRNDLIKTNQLVHIPTRRRRTLADPSWAAPTIRGDRVMWSIAPPGESAMKVNPYLTETVVARLKSPAPHPTGS